LLPTTTRITASETKKETKKSEKKERRKGATKKKGRVCYFSVDPIRYKIDQQPHHGPQNATRTTGTGETKKQDDQCRHNRSHPVKLHALPWRRTTMGPSCSIAGTCFIRRRVAAFLQFLGVMLLPVVRTKAVPCRSKRLTARYGMQRPSTSQRHV
jgi:hypothetical protein